MAPQKQKHDNTRFKKDNAGPRRDGELELQADLLEPAHVVARGEAVAVLRAEHLDPHLISGRARVRQGINLREWCIFA